MEASGAVSSGTKLFAQIWLIMTPTSLCPLKAAWWRLVLPPLSDTLTFVRWGINDSAQRTALLAAATCSGVCQFLSLALISAWCFSSVFTVSWNWTRNCKPWQDVILKKTRRTALLAPCNGASSWDYGTYHIDDQQRLRRACASAQSRQSLPCSHTWSMEVDEGSDQKSDI